MGFLVNVLVNLSVSLSETPAKSCDRKVTKKRKTVIRFRSDRSLASDVRKESANRKSKVKPKVESKVKPKVNQSGIESETKSKAET